jgi:hypothetical protein
MLEEKQWKKKCMPLERMKHEKCVKRANKFSHLSIEDFDY